MAEREQMSILNDGSAKYNNKDEGLLGPGPGQHGIETIPNNSETISAIGQNPVLPNPSSTPVIKTIHTVKSESVPIFQKRDIKIENGNGSDSSHDEKQTGDLRKRVEYLGINDANPPPIDVCRKRNMDKDIEDVPDSRTVKIKMEDVVFEDKEIIFIPKQKPASSSALPQNIPFRTERAVENVSIPLGFVADSGLGRGVNASPTVDVDALPRESAAMSETSATLRRMNARDYRCMNARDYRRALQLRYGIFSFGSSISSSTAGQSSRRQKPHPEREGQKDSSDSASGSSQ